MRSPRWSRSARAVRRSLLLLVVGIGALLPAARPADAVPFTASSASASSAACTYDARSITVTFPGSGRSYLLRVPPGLDEPAMLLVSLHPAFVNNADWETGSGWTPFAAANGFVVAYPQGFPFINTWEPSVNSSPDIPFLLDVVEDVMGRVCIDPDRVHIDGYSMGGWMAQRMVCHSPGTFASASAGGAGHPEDDRWPFPTTGDPCLPSRPVSVFLGMGDGDDLTVGQFARDRWVDTNDCPTTPTPVTPAPGGSAFLYSPCAAGTQVVWRLYTGCTDISATPTCDHFEGSTPFRERSRTERYLFYVLHPRP